MVCIGGNYDAVGHQTAFPLTLNGRSDRTISTEYDHLGNATSIRQHGNAVDEIFAEFEHNANGLLTSVRRYEKDDDTINEIANSLYEYNANSAVTSITHNDSNGSQIVKHSYTYDETNNIVEYLNSIDGNTEYNYDFLGQLISADYANGSIADETYTYDENGNRITANGSNYTTGDNNELTSDGTWTYTYDAEGNRISKTNATNRELYTWDYRNRLTTVTKQTYDTLTNEWTTVQIVEYAYDYNNIWIRKTLDTNGDGIADSKTIFIPENYQTTVQIDNNTVTHHYLWTPNQQDKLLADTTTSGILWALTDHLGTIRDVLDGNSSTHLIYDAFGNLTSGTNPLLFGYTGKPFDADTALQNNINRWYDATIGRWLSTDPIGFDGNDVNLYRYSSNKIIIAFDKFGLEMQIRTPADILDVMIAKRNLSGTYQIGPFYPCPTFPWLVSNVYITISLSTGICQEGCGKEKKFTEIGATVDVAIGLSTRTPGAPRPGPKKRPWESQKNRLYNYPSGGEGATVLFDDHCPEAGFTFAFSLTVTGKAGVGYGWDFNISKMIAQYKPSTGIELSKSWFDDIALTVSPYKWVGFGASIEGSMTGSASYISYA